MMKTMMQAVSLFCCLAALLLGGCGYKTLPVAPQAMTPRPVTDLSYELTSQGAVLRWTYPDRTTTDSRLAELDSFQLYRAEMPADAYCETCPVPFGSPVTLPGGQLPDKGRRQGSWEDSPLRPGNMYLYMLRSRSGWLAESDDSNMVSFVWQNPPAAPAGLTAEADEGRISLRWQPVAAQLDGSPLRQPVKYQISRGIDGGPFANLGGLLSDSVFTDRQVELGHKYAYRVQAVSGQGKGAVGGSFSQTVTTASLDRTPPEPPANVKTARTASAVKVYWDKGAESDLAGYRVYRRAGEAAPQLIGEVKEPYNIFEDAKPLPKGAPVFYSVSSFDQSSPPNESRKSAEAGVRQ